MDYLLKKLLKIVHIQSAVRNNEMADKKKMACNKPTASDRAGKKKMVKGCESGKEKLIHFGANICLRITRKILRRGITSIVV